MPSSSPTAIPSARIERSRSSRRRLRHRKACPNFVKGLVAQHQLQARPALCRPAPRTVPNILTTDSPKMKTVSASHDYRCSKRSAGGRFAPNRSRSARAAVSSRSVAIQNKVVAAITVSRMCGVAVDAGPRSPSWALAAMAANGDRFRQPLCYSWQGMARWRRGSGLHQPALDTAHRRWVRRPHRSRPRSLARGPSWADHPLRARRGRENRPRGVTRSFFGVDRNAAGERQFQTGNRRRRGSLAAVQIEAPANK